MRAGKDKHTLTLLSAPDKHATGPVQSPVARHTLTGKWPLHQYALTQINAAHMRSIFEGFRKQKVLCPLLYLCCLEKAEQPVISQAAAWLGPETVLGSHQLCTQVVIKSLVIG